MDESTRSDLDSAWAEFLKKEALSGGLDVEDVYKSEEVMKNLDQEKEPKKSNSRVVKEAKEVKNNKETKGVNDSKKTTSKEVNKKESVVKEASKTAAKSTVNKAKGKSVVKGPQPAASGSQAQKKNTKKAETVKNAQAKTTTKKDNKIENKVDNNVEEKTKATKTKVETVVDSKKDEQIAELKEKVVRNMAEFENYRKRTEKEKTAMFEVGAKSIIEKLLPVIDNFERGLDAVTEEEKNSAFAQGIDMIYKQLIQSLEAAGVKRIEAVGKEFDPDFHNAVMHAEDDSLGENIVSEEFQKGYMYRDSVIRHSLVKVVN